MRRGEAGSMLIEALVSTAIVASVLGVTFEALNDAGRRREAIDERRSALMIARSRLAAVGTEIAVVPGETQGGDGGFVWTVRIEPAGPAAVADGRLGPPDLVTVSVRSARGGLDLASLKTLKPQAAR